MIALSVFAQVLLPIMVVVASGYLLQLRLELDLHSVNRVSLYQLSPALIFSSLVRSHGTRKRSHRNKAVAANAIGSQRLYEFVEENPGVELRPVDHTKDDCNIAGEESFVAINATLEVDFLGQCASESLGSEYWSSSGGQPDFARGALFSEHGQSFIVLHSTTRRTHASGLGKILTTRVLRFISWLRRSRELVVRMRLR